MKIKKILFYCPSKITGGTEYLFKRCSEYLAENQSRYEILYADYSDGFVRENIKTDKVRFIEVGHDKKVYVEDGTIVILQLNMIYQRKRYIIFNKDKSICLFWCLHTLNLKNAISAKNLFWISKCSRRKLGVSLSNLAVMNIVKFMSQFAYYTVLGDFFQNHKELDWLPNVAPVHDCQKIEHFSRISSDVWKFCWLGRLDAEKSRNIETYMNELEELYKTTPISLSIIGNGPSEDYLKNIACKYSYPIVFVGEKRGQELDKYIREEVEIGLASGISAFEFVLRGKPVIVEFVIDKVYSAGVRKTYIYTHEDEMFDNSCSDRLIRTRAGYFQYKVDAIINNYAEIAEAEYGYVLSKSVDNCCEKLVNTIHQIECLDPNIVEKELRLVESIVSKARNRIEFIYKLTHPFK